MPNYMIKLTFAGAIPELVAAESCCFSTEETMTMVRGKTPGAWGSKAGTFQWTSAVRALCALMIRQRLNAIDPSISRCISGRVGSIASSLDYALAKNPTWLVDFFGVEASGNSKARRIFVRTNSHMKRPGDLIVTIKQNMLAPSDIVLFLENRLVSEVSELSTLLEATERDCSKPRECSVVAETRETIEDCLPLT
jgi:hypothetical protein